MQRLRGCLVALVAYLALAAPVTALEIDAREARSIAEQVWRNETGGDPRKLLWWNTGEAFASLGIGHFIWFPTGVDAPFEESFPALLAHLEQRGVALPAWLRGQPPCPWADREAFLAARDGDSARELEALLRDTFDLQAEFLLGRLEAALPAILAAVDPARRDVATGAARALLATPAGRYALIDYVNFKGTGLSPRERYQGEGWGLAQVLAAMPEDVDRSRVARAFADAAAAAMRGRVARAPPERNEARWLPGWLKRIDTYRR